MRVRPDLEGQRALVLASGPSDQVEMHALFLARHFHGAETALDREPLLRAPDEGILLALQLAAIRGVEVRILASDEA